MHHERAYHLFALKYWLSAIYIHTNLHVRIRNLDGQRYGNGSKVREIKRKAAAGNARKRVIESGTGAGMLL